VVVALGAVVDVAAVAVGALPAGVRTVDPWPLSTTLENCAFVPVEK
jgi:hypothetical protein